MEPDVSVVLTVYNAERTVGEVIESIFNQTLANFELIVVDDGSVDGTGAILAALSDPRLRVVREGRLGRARALNRALAHARAPFIAIVDADDPSYPERLERQAAFLRAHADVGVHGCGTRVIDELRNEAWDLVSPPDDASLRRLLRWRNPLNHSAVMLRRDALDRVGGYDERLPSSLDWDLWARIAADGRYRFASLPEVLATSRIHRGQYFERRRRVRYVANSARVHLRILRRLHAPLPLYAVPLLRLGYHALPEGIRGRGFRLLHGRTRGFSP